MKSRNLSPRVAMLRLALLGVGVTAVTGCGSGLANVTGQVTLDGQPIVGGSDVRGTIYLYPEGGLGAPASGILDEEGRYDISTGTRGGVAPGPYLVSISAIQIIPPRIEGDAPGGRPLTPRKYANPNQSGYRVDVAAGSNTFDFALESDRRSKSTARR